MESFESLLKEPNAGTGRLIWMAWRPGQPTLSGAQPSAPYLEPHSSLLGHGRGHVGSCPRGGGLLVWRAGVRGELGLLRRTLGWWLTTPDLREAAPAPEGGSEGSWVQSRVSPSCWLSEPGSGALCGTGAAHRPTKPRDPQVEGNRCSGQGRWGPRPTVRAQGCISGGNSNLKRHTQPNGHCLTIYGSQHTEAI